LPRLAEVKYKFIGCAEEYVASPAVQYLRSQFEITAVQLLQHRVIAIKAVGCDGHNIISRAQPQELRQLYCAQHIADAGWAKQIPQTQGKIPIHAHANQRVHAIMEDF